MWGFLDDRKIIAVLMIVLAIPSAIMGAVMFSQGFENSTPES